MQVSPALPWTGETEGGTIVLASPVSYQDLLDGVLQFTLDHNDTPLIANVGEGSSGVVIGYGEGGTVNIVYTIDRFEGQLTVLEIARGTGAQADGYTLADVKRATGPLAEVYADEACTTRPVVDGQYTRLYVKVNKSMGYDEQTDFSSDYQFETLFLNTDSEEHLADPYNIILYEGFFAPNLQEGYSGVIECSAFEEMTVSEPLKVNFGHVYE